MIAPEVEEVLKKHPNAKRDSLIPILQEVQERMGYLSPGAVVAIGRHLNLPASKVYGVATFYNQFRFQAIGTFHIQCCRGTACHVRGSLPVLEALIRSLGINPGETTKDGVFSLEVVACLGACGQAPVLCINDEFYAKVTPDEVKKILDTCRGKAGVNAQAN